MRTPFALLGGVLTLLGCAAAPAAEPAAPAPARSAATTEPGWLPVSSRFHEHAFGSAAAGAATREPAATSVTGAVSPGRVPFAPTAWGAAGAAAAGHLEPRAPSGNALLQRELRETTVRGLRFQDEESLSTVVGAIRDVTGLPIVVHASAEAAVLDEGVLFEFELEHPISVRDALQLVTSMAGDEVVWTVRHEAVIVTTRDKARRPPVIVMHDVRDLTFARTDFVGPRIDRLRLLDDIDDENDSPFGSIGESVRETDEEELVTMVQENVAVGTWDDHGHRIDASEGFLVVVHTPEVQILVRRFLNALR
jgi:hypothetical protein